LRLGLAGGGTDLSPYCDEFGGAVLNMTIDRFAHARISPRDDGLVAFRAEDLAHEEMLAAAPALPGANLLLHRGVYERMVRDYNGGAPIPLTMTTKVDAPPNSGLGSSSTLVVALVHAFAGFLGIDLDPYELARTAFEIERVELGLPGGRQDQYAAAFGGANFIEFRDRDRVVVNPLRLSNGVKSTLESSLVVCFAGSARDPDSIIAEQTARVADRSAAALAAMDRLKAGAVAMKRALLLGDVAGMAEVLADSWRAKKATACGISTGRIERLCEIAFCHGALAGKVSGAGGGGFLMFIVPPAARPGLIAALAEAGAAPGPVRMTERGSEAWPDPAQLVARSARRASIRRLCAG
jgi:D-glycero-alpha-D-manno-heptose-7-phosphate kinase